MAETLSTLSIISFVVAGVALALAIVLWFFFEIPTVIGDLTGRNARKSIARMRTENEKSGVKNYKESKTNAERGKLTETMSGIKSKSASDGKMETGLLVENKAEVIETEETGLLESEATGLLEPDATGLLIDEDETATLGENVSREKRVGGKPLTIIEEIMLIHTDEVINY